MHHFGNHGELRSAQYNPSCASAEQIAKRLLMIERTVKRSPRSPDFEGMETQNNMTSTPKPKTSVPKPDPTHESKAQDIVAAGVVRG